LGFSFSFSLSYALILPYRIGIARKKNEKKKRFFWHSICYAILAWSFGTGFAMAAILADRGQNLPFWQMPLFIGVETFLHSSTPQSGYHNQ
jgi:hypothetical protein